MKKSRETGFILAILIISIVTSGFSLLKIRNSRYKIWSMSNEVALLVSQKDSALEHIKYLEGAIKVVQALGDTKKIIERNCLLVYFPKNGCFSCLEDLLTKKLPNEIMNNEVTIYSDFDRINRMIININDSYRTQFESYFGESLLEGNPDEIYLFVYNENDTFSLLKKDLTGHYFKE